MPWASATFLLTPTTTSLVGTVNSSIVASSVTLDVDVVNGPLNVNISSTTGDIPVNLADYTIASGFDLPVSINDIDGTTFPDGFPVRVTNAVDIQWDDAEPLRVQGMNDPDFPVWTTPYPSRI